MDHMDRVRNRQAGKDRPRIRDKQADGGKARGQNRYIKRLDQQGSGETEAYRER